MSSSSSTDTVRAPGALSVTGSAPGAVTICAVLTVHNRRDLTRRVLESLRRAAQESTAFELRVVIVDDGSTDGTSDVIRAAFPTAVVLQGDGTLFWAGGMAMAMAEAMRGRPDHILWMNDDVVLDDDAIPLALAETHHSDIVVGAMRDTSGKTTYSGLRNMHGGLGRLTGAVSEVEPTGHPEALDTFHGNFVLISRRIYESVGNVDGSFAHGIGDVDYGRRARRQGARISLLGRAVAVCELNPIRGTWEDSSLPTTARIRLLLGRKSFPLRSQWRFCARNAGFLAPLWFAATYASALKRILGTRSR